MGDENMSSMEDLLNTPYWIIDILPMRVPKEAHGQYFAVEDFFLKEHLETIKKKHINLVLKLNCYLDITMDGESNPSPTRIAKIMNERYVYIMVGDSMILSEPDDTHMTLFHPDEQLLGLVEKLSAGEGLFVWEGSN